jgi:hypothetical protein
MTMKRRTLVTAMVAAAPILFHASSIYADDPQTDEPGQGPFLNRRFSGHLEGDSGGRFAYYRFYYPGDARDAWINLQVVQDERTIMQNVGIKIYGPRWRHEYFSGGQRQGRSPNVVGGLSGFDRHEPGIYTVQVFNYNTVTPVDFQIWTDGLPAQPANPVAVATSPAAEAVRAPAPVPTPISSDNSTPDGARYFEASQSGSLPGGRGGRFAFYNFAYPGGWPVKIELKPDSTDRIVLRNIGFKVYGPEPGKEYVVGRLEGDEWKGVGDFWTNDQGTFLIQVYNYNPNPETVVGFALLGTGIPPRPTAPPTTAAPVVAALAPSARAAAPPAPRAPSGDGTSPEQSIALTEANGSGDGTLPGGPGGRFRYFRFEARVNVDVTVRLRLSSVDPAVVRYVGFRVYGPDPGKEYFASQYNPDLKGEVLGTFRGPVPGTYYIQVNNYNPDPTSEISFALEATGIGG